MLFKWIYTIIYDISFPTTFFVFFVMDIIRLYEAKKPYHPVVRERLEKGYQAVVANRMNMGGICLLGGLLFVMSSSHRSWREVLVKCSVLGGACMLLTEAHSWNTFLAQMYVCQKNKITQI